MGFSGCSLAWISEAILEYAKETSDVETSGIVAAMLRLLECPATTTTDVVDAHNVIVSQLQVPHVDRIYFRTRYH